MNLNKQVVADLKTRLTKELYTIYNELNGNRSQIKKLAERQWVLKKEATEMYKLLRTLDPPKVLQGEVK